MIRVLLHDPATRGIVAGDEGLLKQWQQQSDTILWLDLADNDPEVERRLLVDTLGLHPLAVQDAQRSRHQPKIEAFSDNVFILLKGLGPDKTEFDFETIQMAMFIGNRFLVTRHSGASTSIERLWRELQDDASTFARGPDAVALRLARISVDRYLNRLLTLEPRLEDLEVDIVRRPRDDMLAELIGFKTDLQEVPACAAVPRAGLPRIDGSAAAAGVHGKNPRDQGRLRAPGARQQSRHLVLRAMASDLIDGYISLASHRLNNIMKVLTIITAIFVPLSFLAGIYGMNFEYMPELKSHSGYFILLGVMFTIVTTLLLVFRKWRWL